MNADRADSAADVAGPEPLPVLEKVGVARRLTGEERVALELHVPDRVVGDRSVRAEALGEADLRADRSQVGDTDSVGFSDMTGGSRVTYATGMAVIEATRGVIEELRARAATQWSPAESWHKSAAVIAAMPEACARQASAPSISAIRSSSIDTVGFWRRE